MRRQFLRYAVACLAVIVAQSASAAAQITTRVSVDSMGNQGDSASIAGSMSSDGRFVAFSSLAANLVPGDTNNQSDVFVHDRLTGQTTRVSVSSTGVQGDLDSAAACMSAGGRYVAFYSFSTNLIPGDTNGWADAFVHDCQTGVTTLLSVNSLGMQGNSYSTSPWISADGRLAVFESAATNLVPGDANGRTDVFVRDLSTGQVRLVSVDSAGVQGNGPSRMYGSGVSADGRIVVFDSESTNLVAGDTNHETDIFVHDILTGQTRRVSVDSSGAQGNQFCAGGSISADGSVAVFYSYASNLVPGDTNGKYDIFVHDLQTGQTSRVSLSSAGMQANLASIGHAISANGRFVAFDSSATNLVLGDTNGKDDVFVHDRKTGLTKRVTADAYGSQGDGHSFALSISDDGRYVAFNSWARNLVPGDTGGFMDVFVHEGGAPGPRLVKAGSCANAAILTITGATPDAWVALIYGPAGIYVKPGSPCPGLILSLGMPELRRLLRSDAAGEVEFRTVPPAAACGLFVQAVDVAGCAASNAVAF